jgi:putative transposase
MLFVNAERSVQPIMSYRVRRIQISRNHELYPYLAGIAKLSNNLANAVRFRQRQVMTAVRKDATALTVNEKSVMGEIAGALPAMGGKYAMPDSRHFLLGYTFLNRLMYVTKNPDYTADGLPRHTAQHMIKLCCREMKSYFRTRKSWKRVPSAFTGEPQLPGYRRKGGMCGFAISNQEATLRPSGDGRTVLMKLPHTKTRLNIGYIDLQKMRLKEVSVSYADQIFTVAAVLEDESEDVPVVSEKPARVCAVDLGVNNLMAVTNNCGLPCLLYKGGIVKSVNRQYNRKIAWLQSAQTKGTSKKYVPDDTYYRTVVRRNNRISDCMHKTAKHFVSWCVENRIDTIVLGRNRYWKQNVSLGRHNDQEFVQIPFTELVHNIGYLAERHGIRVIMQEESYTSKASFPDMDDIPVYHASDNRQPAKAFRFSGRRITRGLYRSKDGTVINADLNGSANILRKAFPCAFDKQKPAFGCVDIIVHPDYRRCGKSGSPTGISRSKLKRLNRKHRLYPVTVSM